MYLPLHGEFGEFKIVLREQLSAPEGAEILEGFPCRNLPRKTDSELLRCRRASDSDASVLKGCGRNVLGLSLSTLFSMKSSSLG